MKEVVPVLPDMTDRADACASGCVSAAWGDAAERNRRQAAEGKFMGTVEGGCPECSGIPGG